MRLLFRQIGEEFARERGLPLPDDGRLPRGAPGEIHRRTGLSLSYVRKLNSGERDNVTAEQIDKVVRSLRISWGFFTDPNERHYTECRRKSDDELPEAYVRWRPTYRRFDELNDQQQAQLEQMRFRNGIPLVEAVGTYTIIADAMLGPPAAPVRDPAEVDAKAAELGVKKVPK